MWQTKRRMTDCSDLNRIYIADSTGMRKTFQYLAFITTYRLATLVKDYIASEEDNEKTYLHKDQALSRGAQYIKFIKDSSNKPGHPFHRQLVLSAYMYGAKSNRDFILLNEVTPSSGLRDIFVQNPLKWSAEKWGLEGSKTNPLKVMRMSKLDGKGR
ncbi:hypothetical protein FOTG_11116 [Fusarium oxysporum f. sp. vasinfectum 25433]|uniref:Uncharacterized protein n=1 Tax=Fusarium oxysporum f. sp. vasinfectum 25433 TaxID=1089449 RepID=X0L595_FUSOX|nr:hypothetical protein FOTG_11116 [Fusarium oxysporum f. sp. vasinfectum 25433]